MTKAVNSGERLSFYQLFKQKNMRIEIPLIQRDYAQGRRNTEEIRMGFLQALYGYLDEGRTLRDLDFVYGRVMKNGANGRDCFIPLDGQQRLTTLFLLHWYLAQLAGEEESLRSVLGYNGTSLFAYETRSSSREFCSALLNNDIDLHALLLKEAIPSLSSTIRDRGWFYASWENDPTIQSMLVMLDAIHKQFSGRADFFEKLTDDSNPVITFLFLNLDKFKLTDDLYIKMNARGKPLTEFENFKAQLEKKIKSFSGGWNAYYLVFKNTPVSGYDYFIHKIDTDWTDLFWFYHNAAPKEGAFDDKMMSFIAFHIANFSLIHNRKASAASYRSFFDNQGNLRHLSFLRYDEEGYISQDLIVSLIKRFDLLFGSEKGNSGIQTYLDSNTYYPEEEIFKKILANSSSFTDKLQFHAFYAALENGKSGTDLLDWMRVVFNLTENTIIEDYPQALQSIDQLANMQGNILDLLINQVPVRYFLQAQVLEERIKAHLLKKSPEWKAAILKAEASPFFTGQIGYALAFSEVVAYFQEHKHVNWSDDATYLARFNDYAASGAAVFDKIAQSSANLNYAWERAVLSKGDYLTTASANRRNLLSARTTKSNVDRDHSWRRLLRLPMQKDSWGERQSYVKAVFDDPKFNMDDLQNSLEMMCSEAVVNQPTSWQSLLIKQPALFEVCKQGFIVKTDDEIILLHESQRNHYQSELYTRFLDKELTDEQIAAFGDRVYWSVRDTYTLPALWMDDFSLDGQDYKFHAFYEKSQYALYFSRDEEDQLAPYPSELIDCLIACGFEQCIELNERINSDDWKITLEDYVCFCEDPHEALEKIILLCKKLVELL
ncbi:DUF262 domain-containing protein [Paenalcaligenes faecalis]|uniref:DUF262 domain-containing protein n=1 Tax=Paenalcaligenes faecalis TaxID=2980099 RepID=UPI0022B959B2|nr:DUF262 domain-containing protein [Paenalcaligenes faecalis]